MKNFRKALCLIVSLVMVLALIPAAAATEDQRQNVGGASSGAGVSSVQDGQVVVYGNDGASWIVLDSGLTTTGEPGLALLAEGIVDANIAFNKGGLDNAWANSDAKTWNADYAASAFSAAELAAILDTTKAEEAGTYFGASWSKDALSAEKLFFLSAAEIQDYFGDSIEGLIAEVDGVKEGWWIRSAYTDRDIYGGIVSDSGFVGAPHVAATWGARPAFNISADKIVMTSAAVGGKVSGTVGADGVVAIENASSNQVKLTVVDDAHSSFAATIGDGAAQIQQTIGYESWVLPITYSGAATGENEYVSVLIFNQNDKAVYYGHIAANSASGTVNVNMPAGLSGKYTVSVFAEQCNGDNATDFGSLMVSAELNIEDGISGVDSWGLVLQGDIRADFLMNLSDTVVNDSTSYIQITVDDITTKTLVSDIIPENGLYRISTNVAAAQMTEDIVIQVITATVSGNEYLYSVRKYGDYILANSSDEGVCDLVKAMLNYGGKAQTYFDYNLNDMADNGIAIAEQTIPYTENLVAVKEGSSENVKYYGASLIHEHQTTLRFYFSSTDEAIANLTFSASVDGTVIDSNMEVMKIGDKYAVQITDIAPNDLLDEIKISVDGYSVTYSPFYYIHRMYYKSSSSAVLRNLMNAMYNYYCYAVAYLDA